jgi:peptidoglycan pentaglycine glycine transferase (the first glycine)
MDIRQCNNKQQWDDYVLENGGHPLQLSGWGDVKSAHGWSAYRLLAYNLDEAIIGGAQVLIKHLPWPLKSLAYIPRGPISETNNREELLSSLADYVKKTFKSVVLTIEPDETIYDVPQGWNKSNNYILPGRTILLDLDKSLDALQDAMAKKTRQYIRKSAKESFTIKMVKNQDELTKCLDVYHSTAKRAGFDLHDDAYYRDVFSRMGDHSPVFAAYQDDQPIAFLWLAISADTAFELYGGMNEAGQELRANYALKWHVIRKCKEWGLRRYDFGGLLDGGITTFKRGWAEEETNLAGTFDKPLSVFYFAWNSGLPMAKKLARKISSLFKR